MRRSDEGYTEDDGPRSGQQTIRQAVSGLRPFQAPNEPPKREHETQWAADFAQEYQSARGRVEVITAQKDNWKDLIPPGSKWQPGLLGKPDCAMCLGMGFVGADLPVGHPKQGKLMYCECRRRDQYPRLKSKKEIELEARTA